MHPETSQAASAQGSLTSDPDRFSDDAWDLLLVGQDVARRRRHGQLDAPAPYKNCNTRSLGTGEYN
ncbi:hypothetical protein PMIT1313_02335 [Prochlorococcus marinus str. MIT 1313]|uniref:hypothetical protein n=1 Tax=Prochlorococcus TaxID=1218 RepID=UPI0007B34361|nr:hypothetical protein [Prochlorococcus marinus]KZR68711.1 hypothetical protein PMIT1313_02335 [Prochlorococcus marinus str. MIT 1313]